jgi:hypothetical protein
MGRTFESVHTVNEYYDGPRLGVADFDGRPHVYRSLWLDAVDDDDDCLFALAPISPEAFAAVVEDWTIWRRFEHAYHHGQVQWSGEDADWGALPEDGTRHRQLAQAVEAALVIDESLRHLARGAFRAKGTPEPAHRVSTMHPLEVLWEPVH